MHGPLIKGLYHCVVVASFIFSEDTALLHHYFSMVVLQVLAYLMV